MSVMSSCSHAGITSSSARAVEQAVVVLHVHELRHAQVLGRGGRLLEHLRGEVRAADLPHLARGDELAERLEGVADRGLRVGQVQEVEVDVVGAEPPQAVVDGLADPLRAPAAEALGHAGPTDLGGDHGVAAGGCPAHGRGTPRTSRRRRSPRCRSCSRRRRSTRRRRPWCALRPCASRSCCSRARRPSPRASRPCVSPPSPNLSSPCLPSCQCRPRYRRWSRGHLVASARMPRPRGGSDEHRA